MNAVWARARAQLRRRVAGVVVLAVVIGLGAGVVMAAAAGAIRTQTAFPRYLTHQRVADAGVASGEGGLIQGPVVDLEKIRSLPQVTAASISRQFFTTFAGDCPACRPRIPIGDGAVTAYSDARDWLSVSRPKVLQGRLPNPNRADEIVVGYASWVRTRVAVGTRLTYRLIQKGDPRQLTADPKNPPLLPPVQLRVVGIVIAPGMFPEQEQGSHADVLATPAFYRSFAGRALSWPEVNVRLRRGIADVPVFQQEVEAMSPGALVLTGASDNATVQRAIHVEATALWLFAGLAAIAGLFIFGQALARRISLDATENPTLRGLGMTTGQLFSGAMLRVGLVGVGAAAAAVITAILLSPLTPVGLARVAEPAPGLSVNTAVLALGGFLTIALLLLVAAAPAWRAARVHGDALGTADIAGRTRPSLAAGGLASAGAPVSAVAGVGMALDPGRGRSSTPVRSTVVGVTLALVSLTAAVTFGASFSHLENTPRLYGWTWDIVGGDPYGPEDLSQGNTFERLRSATGIRDAASGNIFRSVRIRSGNGPAVAAPVLALAPVKGSVHPTVLEGRWPASADEIALGTITLRDAGARVGDSVRVEAGGAAVSMRVVGRVVIPELGQGAALGQGAGLTFEGVRTLVPTTAENTLFITFASNADPAFKKKISYEVGASGPGAGTGIVNLEQVNRLPLILAALIALAGLGTLVHTLATSVYRRRHDLAILKTLGFLKRQVGATVAWQATTLVACALVIGLPLGVLAGRWAWAFFADRLGVVPEPITPLALVFLAIPAAILLANLIAAVPGLIAARTKPAIVLRSE